MRRPLRLRRGRTDRLYEVSATMPNEDFVDLGDYTRHPLRAAAAGRDPPLRARDRGLSLPAGREAHRRLQRHRDLGRVAASGRCVPVVGIITPVLPCRRPGTGASASSPTPATVEAGICTGSSMRSTPASRFPGGLPGALPLIEGDDPYGEGPRRTCASMPTPLQEERGRRDPRLHAFTAHRSARSSSASSTAT